MTDAINVIVLDAPRWMDVILMALIAAAVFSTAWALVRFGISAGRLLLFAGWAYMGGRFSLGFALLGELQISISGMPALILLSGGCIACAIELALLTNKRNRRRRKEDHHGHLA